MQYARRKRSSSIHAGRTTQHTEPLETRHLLSSIYVDAAASGAQNGTSWTNAYPSLQTALQAAQSGDTILVAGGTYSPTITGQSSDTFQLKNGVEIDGGYAGNSNPASPNTRNITATPSILSNLLNSGQYSLHIVTGSGTIASAVLDGFTVNGRSFGTGLYDNNGSPTIDHCTFTGSAGGAIANESNSAPDILNCTFSNNSAGYMGGAIFNDQGSNATITGCTFTANSAEFGGAVAFYDTNGTINNCSFIRNTTTGLGIGGGLYISGSPQIINSSFDGNNAQQGGGAYVAGDSVPLFLSCTMVGNTGLGGGISSNTATEQVINCTITDNTEYGIYSVINQSGPNVVNSIVWGNQGGDIDSTNDIIYPTYSDTTYAHATTANQNVNVTPNFVTVPSPGPDNTWGTADDNYGNLQLNYGSPLIDVGNNAAYSATYPTTDIANNPRIANGTGENTTAPIIDIGAYETPDGGNTITGKVFDGLPDSIGGGAQSDPGLPNVTVYLDRNNDGQLDAGDFSTTSDANGIYSFSDLPPGTFVISQGTRAGMPPAARIPRQYRVPTAPSPTRTSTTLPYPVSPASSLTTSTATARWMAAMSASQA